MRPLIVSKLWIAAFAPLFLAACAPQPIREKTVTVTVAQYVPLPAKVTTDTPHYAMPDPACPFTAADGTVSRTYCIKQIVDALAGEGAQLDQANADKACIRALGAGKAC